MQSREKGQAILEFAFVLPLFLFIVFALFFVGMVMADYMELNSIARSSARDAAVITDKTYYEKNYKKIRDKYKDNKLPVEIFKWDYQNENDFKIEYNDNHNVTVTLNARLNPAGSALAETVYGLANYTNSDFKLNITYTMYSEYKPDK